MKTKSGECLKADKVIVAVPLSIFQSRFIQFKPALPEEKLNAIDRLGAGLIEKVYTHFFIVRFCKLLKKNFLYLTINGIQWNPLLKRTVIV